MEDPPPSRYPMMRSPRGGQQPANSNAHMHFPGRQFGAGNRSIGSRPSGTGHFPSIGGQKRDSSGFAVTGNPARHGGPGQGGSSQDSPEGGNFVKLFVGSVPRTVTEDDIRPLFAEHGNVLEVALIKEKRTGQQQGCCFIKYATIEEADRAIRALHNQRTLPGGIGPIQVRYADGERERLGAVEYKLFVGSLNRLATEKEIEEIFAPYGRVDDVYIMRDEQKQSRGCAFVKYPSREMASSAINALSGTYVMKGCDQPLTVRFADPKRPKTGEMRGAPAFGGPGFGPRPQGPLGARPPPGSGWHTGRGQPTNWRTLGTPNTVPPSHVGTRPYGSPSTQRGGPVGASAIGGPMGTAGASANGSLQGPVVATAPSQQQGFSPPSAYQQLQAYAQQSSSSQKPSQVQQQLPPMQQEKTQTSHSQVQTPQLAVHQFGQQVQTSQLGVQQLQSSQPLAQQQASFGQIPSSQQSLPVYSQLSISQSQLQQHVALGLQQVSSSLQQHQSSISAVQPSSQLQQQSQLQPQLQLQTQSQVPTQMQLQQQTQSQQQQTVPLQSQSQIQSAFQSQQHLFLQQQHQLHLMQPATQCQQQPQTTQTQKQQTYYQVAAVQSVNQQPSWVLATQPQSVVSTPAIVPVTMSPSAGTAASVVSLASASTLAPMPCSWTEHTSPEGYKYYYNSVTKESRWEKPEELTAFEEQQQQQQQKQQQQLSQSQPQLVTQQQQLQPQNQLRQQQSQILQHQSQMLQPALAMPYTGPGMVAHQPIQNLGYGQLQGASAATVEQSHQVQQRAATVEQSHQVQQHQGLLTMQDWAWKAKPAGT